MCENFLRNVEMVVVFNLDFYLWCFLFVSDGSINSGAREEKEKKTKQVAIETVSNINNATDHR